jgi:hypothetical protein
MILNATDATATIFDLQNGTVVSTGAGFTSAKIEDKGNGWYRLSVTSALLKLFGYGLINDSNQIVFAGTGTSGAYFWGAGAEAGAFATPYIPTVASQVTRLADSAVMTGVNFSSWFNPEQGTLYADFTAASTGRYVFTIRNAAFANDRILCWANGALTHPDGSITSAVAAAKRAVSYQVNSLKMATNGTLNTEDTSVTNGWSDAASVIFGASNLAASGSNMNGYIKRLTYYNQALTAANLQAITR